VYSKEFVANTARHLIQ